MEPQSKDSLPSKPSTVTIVAYLAGDYAHNTTEVFENVPAGTRSLPITLGGIPLGKSTVVIEAKADWKNNYNDDLSTGYYGEEEITVTGGVNTYTVDMDYGVIVACNENFYSKEMDSNNGVSDPSQQIGEPPLAKGEFLILRKGKKPSQQRNFASRLPYNLTAEGYKFEGYVIDMQIGSFTSLDRVTAPDDDSNNPYSSGDQEWTLYSVWTRQ